ncbi:putative phosphoglycerate mutase [Phyllosticta capitalensis]|uniref:Phosphoglycerate mutase n=1 Tax=Phyllosticta capitalensis TaxID=121624 RepID=A0ABR1YWU5_9PEZI
MSDKDAGTPRVYLARHGETEWTINGRYTGVTDLPLTTNGEAQVLGSGRALVGAGKLINPSRLAAVYISPRHRAQQTYELLFPAPAKAALSSAGLVHTTSRLAEWDYGLYEGLLTKEIRAARASRGLDTQRPWDIWRDGCEEGESAAQVTKRLDDLIREIRQIQGPYMHGEKPVDVVLVAHGHLLRAFAKRWLGYPMETPLSMMMEPGGVGVLSYQHHNVEEPAFLLGLALPLPKDGEEVKN